MGLHEIAQLDALSSVSGRNDTTIECEVCVSFARKSA
jgi:hypothetical protein